MIDTLNKKTYWLADEAYLRIRKADHAKAGELFKSFIELSSNDKRKNVFIQPNSLIKDIQATLTLNKDYYKDADFIIDLTGGWLYQEFAPVLDEGGTKFRDFTISRVRNLSNRELKTVGYLVNAEETKKLAKEISGADKIIILDDVAFEGKTMITVRNSLQAENSEVIAVTLVSSVSSIYSNSYAAQSAFIEESIQLESALQIYTPDEDAWHINDLYADINLERLKIILQGIIESGFSFEYLSENLSKILDQLAPNKLSHAQLIEMVEKGDIVLRGKNINEHDEYVVNPPLWFSPYFWQFIDTEKLKKNFDEIFEILSEIQQLETNAN